MELHERIASSPTGATITALNTSGNATTMAAITAPCQVKIRRMPKCSISQLPSALCEPISTSR